MKLFYTKKDRDLVDGLKNEINVLKEKINKKEFNYLKEKENLEKLLDNVIKENKENINLNAQLKIKLENLNHKYKQAISRCGGLTKKNNSLKREIEDLKIEIPKVKRIKKCTGLKQKMQLKSSSKNSEIIKKVVS